MKNYLSTKKGSSRQPSLPKGLRVAFLGIGILLVLFYLVPKLVFGLVSTVVYPFELARLWVIESQDSLPFYLRDRHTLIEQIESLEQQVAVSGGTENTLAKLKVENEQFRLLCEAVPEERVIARVVGRPPKLPYDVIMLDRGSDHGVVTQSPVFVGSDQVIGYVSRVYNKTALVTLVSTAQFESMAYIMGPNIYTYARGVGGGMMRVVVPQGVPLAVGDTVILPAIDSGVYGTVAYIETSPTQPEQYGYVPMKQNLQSLQYVSIGQEPIVPHTYEEAESLLEELRSDLFAVSLPPGVLVTPQVSTTTATTTSPVDSSTSSPAGLTPQ
jgi:cell shape-determining protein MreC